MRPDLQVIGVDRLARDLNRRADLARDVTPALHAFADAVAAVNADRFASGRGWRRLSPDTLRQKAAAGMPPHRMIATGKLMRSLTARPVPGAVRDVRADEAFVGTSLFYARFHRSGTKHMPRRAPVALRKVDREHVLQVLDRHLRVGL